MTRRPPVKGERRNRFAAKSMAPLIEVPPPWSRRWVAAIPSAKAPVVASSLTTVQGSTCTCNAGPVHCTIVTAIARALPERMAFSTRRSRNAIA